LGKEGGVNKREGAKPLLKPLPLVKGARIKKT